MNGFLTIQEVADLMRSHYNTVYWLIRKGELPASKFGWQYRIKKSDLEDYLNREVQEK